MVLKVTLEISPSNVKELELAEGTTFNSLISEYRTMYDLPILGAAMNNKIVSLDSEIKNGGNLKFLTCRDRDGRRIFIRTISFILVKAAKDIFPHADLHIEYSIGNGFFCHFSGLSWIRAEEVEAIENRMHEIIAKNMPIKRERIHTKDAIKIFEEEGLYDRARLFSIRESEDSSIHTLDGMKDYFFGYLAPSTGLIHKFKLNYYKHGIILLVPDEFDPLSLPAFKDSPKFFSIIEENNRWLDIMELEDCGKLGMALSEGRGRETILIAEALHEKKLAVIADEIARRREAIKVVSIAGPSSSGKTTTAKRLEIELRINGFKPFLISLDDYFIDREKTPLDEDGKHDFESIKAIDTELFSQNVIDLMNGKEVELPRYDFASGKSLKSGKKLRLEENQILLVEGIHGLNPELYPHIPQRNIYKVYVSALTQLNIDTHNRIPTTDNRLLRRIVRDSQFRGYSAEKTLLRWASVRRGEEKNIFPFQEQADIMFNTSLVYEFSFLKSYAEPLLKAIPEDSVAYIEAKRLLKFLSFFKSMDDEFKSVPRNSIIREFIGDSVFKY